METSSKPMTQQTQVTLNDPMLIDSRIADPLAGGILLGCLILAAISMATRGR